MNNMNEVLDYNEMCQKEKLTVSVNVDTAPIYKAVAEYTDNLKSEISSLEEEKTKLLEDIHALRAYAEEMRNSFGVILGSMQKVFPG